MNKKRMGEWSHVMGKALLFYISPSIFILVHRLFSLPQLGWTLGNNFSLFSLSYLPSFNIIIIKPSLLICLFIFLFFLYIYRILGIYYNVFFKPTWIIFFVFIFLLRYLLMFLLAFCYTKILKTKYSLTSNFDLPLKVTKSLSSILITS